MEPSVMDNQNTIRNLEQENKRLLKELDWYKHTLNNTIHEKNILNRKYKKLWEICWEEGNI